MANSKSMVTASNWASKNEQLENIHKFPNSLKICLNIQIIKFNHLKRLTTVNSRYFKVDGTIFYKFKLPEVQINLHFR